MTENKMKAEPILTTIENIKSGAFDRQGYVIYAIYDQRGHCAYVGQSKNPSKRFLVHQSNSHVRELSLMMAHNLVSGVEIFLADSFNLFVEKYSKRFDVPNGYTPDPDDPKWANDAEMIVCYALEPYMNIRQTELSRNFDWVIRYLYSSYLEIVNSLMDRHGLSETAFFHFARMVAKADPSIEKMLIEKKITYEEGRCILAREKIASAHAWREAKIAM